MTDPSEDVQEAMYRALLYVEQAPPNPMKPLALLRALQQDGYMLMPEEPSDGTIERYRRRAAESRAEEILKKDWGEIWASLPNVHGYTCGECDWGRDETKVMAEYAAHMDVFHPEVPYRK